MLTTLKEFQERLAALHAGINKTLDDVSSEGLDWRPSSAMNSLGVLAAHVAGSERYWIGTVAGNDLLTRDREAEFRTVGGDAATLLKRLDEVLAHSQTIVSRLTPLDLEDGRVAPRDERNVTVAWALLHALEHTALHLGQMQLMRELWERQGRS